MYQPLRPPRHEIVILRGLRHHLTRWGPASDSPTLLLHGWMDTGDTFQFVVDELPAQRAFVALDWRGFGRSQWEANGYWFPNYLADLDALLDIVSPSRPAQIVGHSMGGNVACLYAGVRSEHVRRLVNIEGCGLPRTSAEKAPERYREWLDQLRSAPAFADYASHDQLAEFLSGRNPRLPPERAAFIARRWAQESAPDRVRISSDPRHKLVNPVLYRREEAEACWRRITAPVLLLLAASSELRPRLGADGSEECFRALIANLRIETLAECGHMMHHERPEAVARLLETFLE